MEIGFDLSGMFVKARNLYMYVSSNKKNTQVTLFYQTAYISNKRIKRKDDIVIPKMA